VLEEVFAPGNARRAAAPDDGATRYASRPMSTASRYRFRTPSTGREVLIDAQPSKIYVDRDTGEKMESLAILTPIGSSSNLPWAVENLRHCPWCTQMAQRDLNDCPTCGRRMGPVGA
jgi:hypothetical protein